MTEVVRRTVNACLDLETADLMCKRITKGLIHHAATYVMLAELILELDESGGWKLYEDDEGKQRYRDVWYCLDDRVLQGIGVSTAVVRRFRRCAYAVAQLFGALSDGERARSLYPNLTWDSKLRYPALPERVMGQLAKLNDSPKEQKRAFDLAMQVSNGKLTEKGVALQVARLLPGPKEDPPIKDAAKTATWVLRVLGSFESNLKTMETEAEIPPRIVKKTKSLIKDLDELYDRVKAT